LVRGFEQRNKLLIARKRTLANFYASDAVVAHLADLRRNFDRIRGCGHVHPHRTVKIRAGTGDSS
jgi:hypothetical protein